MQKLFNFLIPDRFFTNKIHPKPIKKGFMVIDENGVAKMDFDDPKLREHLKKQIHDFSKITVAE